MLVASQFRIVCLPCRHVKVKISRTVTLRVLLSGKISSLTVRQDHVSSVLEKLVPREARPQLSLAVLEAQFTRPCRLQITSSAVGA
jgi:hypothetical protein